MRQFTVTLSLERVATELVIFHHEGGGWRLLPKLEGQAAEAGRIYTLTDGWDADSAPAEIILKPLSDNETEVTLRANASSVWGMRLDSPSAVLDRTAYLGGETSPRNAQFLSDFEAHVRELDRQQQTMPPVPVKPDKPLKPETRDLEDWFRYYHDCQKAGFRVTLRDIADETGYSHDYVRQKHAEYKAEHSP